ncbi:MAG: thiamine phosphate synthase [Rhodomicrobium sp.]
MEAKACGLIVIAGPALQPDWAANLTELAARFRPAAIIFKAPSREPLAEFLKKAKPLQLAVLLADAVDDVRNSGADGIYFSSPDANLVQARQTLGSGAIIGVACGLSRHAAMESAEAGADFFAFNASNPSAWEEAADLSSWWGEVTEVPGALLLGTSRPDSSLLTAGRPDFVLLEETGHAGESLTFAIELGLQSQT